MATSLVPVFKIEDFGLGIIFITVTVTVLWVTAMFVAPQESDATLEDFYRRSRPGGLGWQRQR